MSATPSCTGKTSASRAVLLAVAGIIIVGAAMQAGHKPTRTFKLDYQDAPIVVPADETWRLSWVTPYSIGEVTPAYDVRIWDGAPHFGDDRAIQAEAYAITRATATPLDLRAGRRPAVAWLDGGTRFATANELLQIEVRVYSSNTH